MDNLFLPREVGSIETGPQTFAGTDVLNTTFYFRETIPPPLPPPVDPPGLLNSVLVQNGGYSLLNGVYNFISLFESKPYYNKEGNSNWFMVFFNNQWQIYDFDVDGVDPIYFSIGDVLYPWAVTNWFSFYEELYDPVPTVTKII